MKTTLLLLTTILFLPFVLFCQDNNSLNILKWINPERIGSNQNSPKSATGKYQINYHSLLSQNEIAEEALVVELNNVPSNQISIATLFQPSTNQEQIIWSLEREEDAKSILTTHRTANFLTGKYLNYDQQISTTEPQIQTYFINSKNNLYDKIRIGNKSATPNLPIENFTGLIPEILIFDKILSNTERKKIESYLAIKYGITLNQTLPTNYLSSTGEIIWDAIQNEDYSSNIAGIGKDDYFQLNQKQGISINQPNLLSVSLGQLQETNNLNLSEISNLTYLIWSDNAGALKLKPDALSMSNSLQRKWAMNTSVNIKELTTSLLFDINQIADKIAQGDHFWLKVDKSGTGKFPIEDVELFAANNIASIKNQAVFKEIEWGKTTTKRSIFTLTSSHNSIVPIVEVEQPECTTEKKGSIKLKVFGGESPYQIRLTDGKAYNKEIILTTAGIDQINNLHSGDYEISITDAQGQNFQQDFYLQSVDAPTLNMADTYFLSDNEELELNGTKLVNSTSENLSFHWKGDFNLEQRTPEVTIEKAGKYQLKVTEKGCESRFSFQVVNLEQAIFERIEIFPNPIQENDFLTAKIKLKEPNPLKITITDNLGRTVKEQVFPTSDYFFYDTKIDAPGNYYLTFTTTNQKTTRSIIVH